MVYVSAQFQESGRHMVLVIILGTLISHVSYHAKIDALPSFYGTRAERCSVRRQTKSYIIAA
jgi:hypothetical protein